MSIRPRPSRLKREFIHEETLPFSASVDGFEAQDARRQFSTLFDRAAETVTRAGYDLDDVTLDQIIVQRSSDGVETDTEFGTWLRGNPPHEDRPIVALRVRVYLERWV